MAKFSPFEFTPEVMDRVRGSREIPIHFYNKEGQILIYKKQDATEQEIDRLIRFVGQGNIFYNEEDSEKLGIKKKRVIPEGLSDAKLLGEETAEQMAADTTELFTHLKQASFNSFYAKRTADRVSSVFDDFESQPDAMIGLVNILEVMGNKNVEYAVNLAVKRTVVAMAMKTRGMHAQSYKEAARMKDMVTVLMTSALLCDGGYGKMKMPAHAPLTTDEVAYVQNHPLMSYLMLAHEPTIDPRVKRNILCHHRPMREGTLSNNYPDLKATLAKMQSLEEKYRENPAHDVIARDIREQIVNLKQDLPYDEDANILAIASEFASLTTDVPWRPAFSAERAVRMVINNSYFTYPPRALREFLDHAAISLCDNEKILNEGDFIVIAARSADGKMYFEVARITRSDRYQSRPDVMRIATIVPEISKVPRLAIAGFNLESLKPDKRRAHYDLTRDDTRSIVYAVDPDYDVELYQKLTELMGPAPTPPP